MTEIRPGGTVHHRRRDQFATVERAGAPDTTWVVFRGETDPVEVSTDQLIVPDHLWSCGCLRNDAGAHRVGCPDHPEGIRGER